MAEKQHYGIHVLGSHRATPSSCCTLRLADVVLGGSRERAKIVQVVSQDPQPVDLISGSKVARAGIASRVCVLPFPNESSLSDIAPGR